MSCSIRLKNLSIYQNKKSLISNLSLSLSCKQKVALIGENGCGKSTLLRTIIGLHREYSGDIEILHQAVKKESDFKKMRKIIGFLPQDSDDFFIAPTVLEDVAFSLLCRQRSEQDAYKKANKTLEDLNISHLKDRAVFNLSGGEKKIVALAGLLSFDPDILLLDEPTNGLDTKSIKRVVEILKNIEKSMLIVSHDSDFITDVISNIVDLNSHIVY